MKKTQIILFGIGDIVKNHPDILMEQFDIVSIVDNGKKLHGDFFLEKEVKAPESIIGYSGIVAISAGYKSFPTIAVQLLEMGIRKECIYLLQYSLIDGKMFLIPIEYSESFSIPKKVDEFDLIENPVAIKGGKRIMFFCSFYSIYLVRLVDYVGKRYPEYSISIVTQTKDYYERLKDKLEHLYVFGTFFELECILNSLDRFDVFQTLWIENCWAYFFELLRSKCDRLNLCIGGSDLYRSDKDGLSYKKPIIDDADVVSGETPESINAFLSEYPDAKGKMRCVIHGVSVLDEIDKVVKSREDVCKQFGIPSKKMIVTCGHNANKAHQHDLIIKALKDLPLDVLDEICFVFPMAYNSVDARYIGDIRVLLTESGVDFRLLTDFMNDTEMAEYATVSDIMIHVQKTDQLSSTMLEEMYAGAVVIAGSWLPYGSLRDAGITFFTVDTMEELGPCFEKIVTNLSSYKDQCKRNREIIRRKFSWDATIDGWISLWDK